MECLYVFVRLGYQLAWKIATPLSLLTAKSFELTLLKIANELLILHCNATIFVAASGDKTDQQDNLPPQICIKSYCSVNLCPVFYLKAYLRCAEPFFEEVRWITSVLSSLPLCANIISSWVRKVIKCYLGTYVSGYTWGVAAPAALVAAVFLLVTL